MDFEVALLTFTSSLIILLNINTMLMSAMTLYFNGAFFKRSDNIIRRVIYYALIVSMIKSASVLIPSWIWLVDQSYLKISFGEATFWAFWHLWACLESFMVNVIACYVGIKNCYEIRDFLIQKKNNLENLYFSEITT